MKRAVQHLDDRVGGVGPRGRWRRASGIGLAALLLAGGCTAGDDGGPADPADRSDAVAPGTPTELAANQDFYALPESLPDGSHGDLVRYQRGPGAPDGVTWYRVMYLSETLPGEATVVTGVVTVPASEPPAGGWPLVSHAHGGLGLADTCAPSANLGQDHPAAIEIGLLANLAATRGYVVASSDLEGLGGPGRNPLLVGPSEGRSVLDIAVAARQLPGVDIGATTAIAGYSQGGHAALWANQIAPQWTPDLDIIGTMAGAPAVELADLAATLPADLQESWWIMPVGGLAAAYPEADPADILTPAGLDLLDHQDDRCPANYAPGSDTPLLRAHPTETEPWATLLDQNTPGQTAADSPILVIHSAQDQNVPIATTAALLDRQCAAGQVVERRVVPEGDHVVTAVPAYQQALDWFDSLTTGTPPQSSCP